MRIWFNMVRGSILAMSSLQTFLPLTSLLNLIFSGPTLTPALQIRFPYLELPYCTITNDLAMDGISQSGGTSRPEGREVRVGGVTFWACRINGGGGNFLKYPLPGRGKFFICLNCLKITDPPEQSLNRFKLLGFN